MALASPLESIESAVIWLLVVFSVATWGLALLKGVQFGRLKAQDRKFHHGSGRRRALTPPPSWPKPSPVPRPAWPRPVMPPSRWAMRRTRRT